MPTFDQFLPPRSYSVWHAREPREPIYPVAAAFALILRWTERASQRRALAALDERMLRDIGVTRIDAMRESEKPFWR